jgi:hypothetical protein
VLRQNLTEEVRERKRKKNTQHQVYRKNMVEKERVKKSTSERCTTTSSI